MKSTVRNDTRGIVWDHHGLRVLQAFAPSWNCCLDWQTSMHSRTVRLKHVLTRRVSMLDLEGVLGGHVAFACKSSQAGTRAELTGLRGDTLGPTEKMYGCFLACSGHLQDPTKIVRERGPVVKSTFSPLGQGLEVLAWDPVLNMLVGCTSTCWCFDMHAGTKL